nr:hypothetical protein [Emcibacter nanhaiensis]
MASRIDVLATGVTIANKGFQRPARELGVREAEEIHCTRSCFVISSAIIVIGTNCQPVARGIERHRSAELVAGLQFGIDINDGAHDAGIGPALNDVLITNDDVLGVEQQLATTKGHAGERHFAQFTGGGELHRATADSTGGIDAAQEGGLRVRPDHDRAALAVTAAHIDSGSVIDEAGVGIANGIGVAPATKETVVIWLGGIRRLATLESATDAHQATAIATARINVGRKQVYGIGGDVDVSAFTLHAIGAVTAGTGELASSVHTDTAAVFATTGIGAACSDFHDTFCTVMNNAAVTIAAFGMHFVGQRK